MKACAATARRQPSCWALRKPRQPPRSDLRKETDEGTTENTENTEEQQREGQLQDHPDNSILQQRGVEVQDQTGLLAAEAEKGE